jgi:alpha-mannosidase
LWLCGNLITMCICQPTFRPGILLLKGLFMLQNTTLLAVLLLGIAPAGLSAAEDPSPIEEIHLIHHSHTDLGFTDLASTAMALHEGYIGQAVALADATSDYPDTSRFRWTCESALMVQRFLGNATPQQKARFDKAVQRGQIEVAAMPDNIVGLVDGPEWAAVVRRLAPLWKKYGSRVAMQNDINGFPWGLVPRLREQGIDAVWMGCNGDTSVGLTPTPDAWWWQGPNGQRMLVWSGTHYCFGFELFHAAEWRRGPVPSAADVWYNPPSAGETWNVSRENLDAAEKILHAKLASMQHYKFPVIAFQATNMWRMDNDPPSRQIADFVKAWNEGDRKPRLVMSTPGRFLARLRATSGHRITTVRRGDWQDWWSDGLSTTPELLVASQQAKRILADLPTASQLLDPRQAPTGVSQVAEPPETAIGNLPRLAPYDEAWYDAIVFDEHTWGSFNSIAQPYHPRTAGGFAEKAIAAYRAAERARLAQAAVLRQAKDYCDFSRTRRIRVLNPGTTVRSGWVAIPATAIRFACNAAQDLATGAIYPLEDVREPEWSAPDPASAPFDLPNDVWGWQVKQRRFFLSGLRASRSQDFELVESIPRESSRSHGLVVGWNLADGRIRSLRTAGGVELIDAAAPHALGQVVVETVQGRGQRPVLAARDPQLLAKLFRDEPVKLLNAREESTRYALSLSTTWEHPLVYRVQQRWDVLKDVPRAMLTTTIWTRETADPCGLYMAFPLAAPQAEIVYDSAGYETVFGRDSMPGTCAECLCQGAGLILRGPTASVLLATPDTPLGCVGGPMLRRRLIAPYVPKNRHYYVNVTNNYWHTNFSIMKAGKLVLRHWIEPVEAQRASLAMLSDELWSYPIGNVTAKTGNKR